MLKRFSQSLCLSCLLVSNLAVGLSCPPYDPGRIVERNDTIFVAFVLEGRFVEGEDPDDCGWIYGTFEVVEELKGHALNVNNIKKRLHNCNRTGIAGASDRFPIGKYLLVATNDETAEIGLCAPSALDFPDSCIIDAIRRKLDIAAINEEQREWCIEDERSRGQLSYIDAVRRQISILEAQQVQISKELEEYRKEILEFESNEIDK